MSQSEALRPIIQVQTLTDADTEYTVTLPVGTKYFSMQCRTAFDFRFSFESVVADPGVGPTDPYATVKAGQSYSSPEKTGWSFTDKDVAAIAAAPLVYLGAAQAGVVIEFVVWVDVR